MFVTLNKSPIKEIRNGNLLWYFTQRGRGRGIISPRPHPRSGMEFYPHPRPHPRRGRGKIPDTGRGPDGGGDFPYHCHLYSFITETNRPVIRANECLFLKIIYYICIWCPLVILCSNFIFIFLGERNVRIYLVWPERFYIPSRVVPRAY